MRKLLCTIIRQPVLTNTTGFLLVLNSVSPIIIVGKGACSILPGLTVILRLKYGKKV